MGALLSLPLLALPSVGTLWSIGASCCGAAACSAICSSCKSCRGSMATRITYALILLLNSILSWVMLTPWAIHKLEKLTLGYMEIKCGGGQCYGYVAVHRLNFALGIFHAILGIILLGVKSSRDGRAAIQNGFWGPKIMAWLVLIVLTFLIPENFFVSYGSHFALFLALLFVLIGLILLVDLAHTWAEYCLEKMSQDDSRLWRALLVSTTLGSYLLSIALTVVMYYFFAASGCGMNQAAITVNLLLFLIVSFVSVHPAVQEYNPKAGLAQSAIVAIYCTYLTMSAVSMEPDDKNCNPLVRVSGTRTVTVIIGAIMTMLAVAYTTTRAASQSLLMGNSRSQYIQLEDQEDGIVSAQPLSVRREMRAEALRRAVQDGSLPASALDDDDDDMSDSGSGPDDERGTTQYNYSLFHVIFLLATAWVATLLTQNLDPNVKEDFIPVGRTYWASWVKIISAWVCYLIYMWSLLAPVLMPDRFDN